MLRRFAVFLFVFQSTLFLAHFFLYKTLLVAFAPFLTPVARPLGLILGVLAASFLSTSLLAFRYSSAIVRVLYIPSAIWLGTFNYVFLAALAWWLLYGASAILKIQFLDPIGGLILFGAALIFSLYGLINAAIPRVKRISISLLTSPPTGPTAPSP